MKLIQIMMIGCLCLLISCSSRMSYIEWGSSWSWSCDLESNQCAGYGFNGVLQNVSRSVLLGNPDCMKKGVCKLD